MATGFFILGGIVLAATIFVVYDEISYRQHHRARRR